MRRNLGLGIVILALAVLAITMAALVTTKREEPTRTTPTMPITTG